MRLLVFCVDSSHETHSFQTNLTTKYNIKCLSLILPSDQSLFKILSSACYMNIGCLSKLQRNELPRIIYSIGSSNLQTIY